MTTRSQSLMAGIPVEVDLAQPSSNESVRLASFQTDANGTGSPRFRLPDWKDGSYKLRVAARIGRDEEVITHNVTLHRAWQVMVSTDKPVYRPGDAIRIRSLSLRRPDLTPMAGEQDHLVGHRSEREYHLPPRRRDEPLRHRLGRLPAGR